MRHLAGLAAGLLLSTGLHAQQAPPALYRLELLFNGQAFALDEPKLQGDSYVFHAWPEGLLVHLRRANVRKITRWTKDLSREVVYRIDLVPSGHVLSRDEPVFRGSKYVFRASRDGTVVSLRQKDVRKISRVTGVEAYLEKQGTRGVVEIGNLAMQGGSTQAGLASMSDVARPGTGASNWRYQGTPGVTDAWAPASATVSSPGDVPRIPAATQGNPSPH